MSAGPADPGRPQSAASAGEAIDPVAPEAEIIGYTGRFSVAPGDDLDFMVSGNVPQAQAQLVRLVHGDARSAIGFVEREVDSTLDPTWDLTEQTVQRGSFGRVEARGAGRVGCVSGHLYAQPAMLGRNEPQGLLAQLDQSGEACWELVVESPGDLILRGFAPDGCSQEVRLSAALREGAWHSIAFSMGCDSGTLRLWLTTPQGDIRGSLIEAELKLADGDLRESDGPLLLAARRELATPDGCEPRAAQVFDGKLERPRLFDGELERDLAVALLAGEEPPAPPILDLDLGACTSSWQLWDCTANRVVGRLYNAPLRAIPSHRFDGSVLDPRLEPDHFAAVGFHHDDVHHANWVPTRGWQVPADQPSGIYALRLRSGDAEDRIPFVVRPPRDRATSSVALWIPDFTYAAYANEQDPTSGTSYGEFHPEEIDPLDNLMWRHPEWGASTYDHHADGSGVAISSLARPVPNLRPTYRRALVSGPRHLAGDLFIVQWLEHLGIKHDVITDSDVHAEGAELLSRYDAVLTGGHPEYVTAGLIDAVEEYTEGGGRLMYLGANGFYWVTTVAPDEESTTVEVRRGISGTRVWTSSPGEYHNQFTGEPGGLWRFRGRGPHRTLGIGFVSQGWDGHNRPFRRQEGSFDSRAAWAFAGVGEDEPIGDDGLVMGGAAGDEMDSANRALGTPAETIVLASSSGHSDAYWLVVEDVRWSHGGYSGTSNPLVHADIALTPRPNGGAIFAAGSIAYTACLSWDDYRNPLARLTENVLRAFMDRGSAPWAVR
jgi:N,N-dimethylformamidase